jgi:hypothetical protein
VLGFEGIEHGGEIGLAFAFQDYGLGGESVLDAVQTDGGASFRGFGAGGFLGVLSVRLELFVRCHCITSSTPRIAGEFGAARRIFGKWLTG